MAKKWSELKVGDKVVAVEGGLRVTKGEIYKISGVFEDCIEFIDDKGEFHDATEEWVLRPYEENEKGDDKMTKFKVGDKVTALKDGIDVTEGNVYKVVNTIGDDHIRIIDDADDRHVLEVTDFKLYEEPTTIKANVLDVEVNVDALHTTPNVYPGQVRMSTDGFVILVIEAIYGLENGEEDGYYNTVILKDAIDGELDFACNMPVRNHSGDDIADEFPIVVDAKLTIDKVNGGKA